MNKKHARAVNRWWNTDLGQRVLSEELSHIDTLVSRFVGPYALYMGVGSMLRCLARSRADWMLECYASARPNHARVAKVSFSSLPIRPHSIDGVVLHHLLDVVDDPHGVVREASQVVIPGGRILIIGFNPHSLWGVWRRVRLGQREVAPWNCGFLSPLRVVDWLKVLGFHVDRVEHAMFDFPIMNPELRDRFHWIAKIGQRVMTPFGAVYCLSAVRREYASTGGQVLTWKPRLVTPVAIASPSVPTTIGRCSLRRSRP